jgi:hypothetical protein
MKHGDKAKRKASKASGKKSHKVSADGKSSKAGLKAKKQTSPAKTSPGRPKGGNGAIRSRASADYISFTNPVVAAAFKRAVKKYPNAFRRLTD